ncbi:MAG: signal peptidase [Thermoleophilaceae bacterium]|nr:signal peptidase [Thermoleophilaceae bacterium]
MRTSLDILRRALGPLGWAALAAAFALGALMLLPPLAGYQRYVVTGGSMAGTIPRGSIVYARPVAVDRLRVGDVITYTPPPGAGPGGRVTHRIVWRGRGPRGVAAFRTKGDANSAPDPWRFELRGPTQARVEGHMPLAGYVLAALALRWVRMLVIGLPAALVAVAMLCTAWREARAPAGGEA